MRRCWVSVTECYGSVAYRKSKTNFVLRFVAVREAKGRIRE